MRPRPSPAGAGIVLLMVPPLFSSAPAGEAGADLPAVVDRLQSAYEGLQTLEADFTQTLDSVSLGRPQQERGVVYLRRPAQMRWEYRDPEEKLAVVDGDRTWLYIPAENQVFVGSLAESRRGAVGMFLSGDIRLETDFEVRPGPEELGEEDSDALSLIPRVPGEEFARIDVAVSRETGLPVRIVVHGVLGDRMDYRFSNLRTGHDLPGSLFEFEPPEGVEVVLSE